MWLSSEDLVCSAAKSIVVSNGSFPSGDGNDILVSLGAIDRAGASELGSEAPRASGGTAQILGMHARVVSRTRSRLACIWRPIASVLDDNCVMIGRHCKSMRVPSQSEMPSASNWNANSRLSLLLCRVLRACARAAFAADDKLHRCSFTGSTVRSFWVAEYSVWFDRVDILTGVTCATMSNGSLAAEASRG